MVRINAINGGYVGNHKCTPVLKHSCFDLSRRILSIVFFTVCISIFNLSGCAIVDRGVPVPPQFTSDAHLPGYINIRYSVGNSEHQLVKEFVSAIKSVIGDGSIANVLAISGGGADGAFGAGLLCGWTNHGSRPTFQVVTGVSTGALAAPFAFLGVKYDDQLRNAYTHIHNDDVFVTRNIFAMFRGDSLTTTGPLYHTISRYIDDKLLAKIAKEHTRGRRLFIMTTDLDAQRPVVWNMGSIATSGQPDSLNLFRRIIIASASIPVVFPPQYLKVEAHGEEFTEMHVDGGVMGQVFLHLPPLKETLVKANKQKVRAYVIRNSKVAGEYSAMTPLILPILTRTVATLVRTQGIGDLYEIYEQAKKGNAEYRLAYVPDDFKTDHHDMFEPEAMKKMFDAAYSMAAKGYPWRDRPPEVM